MLVLGTRPELVKLAPLIRVLGERTHVVYTGQHYSDGLYRQILEDLRLRCRFQDLGAVPSGRGAQLGAMVASLDRLIRENIVDAVVVQGDTTSALAGALSANANGIALTHIEAGLRSYDRAMPEEHNRVLIDHLADLCCAPTPVNRDNLRRENIPDERIVVTGNTVVEALLDALPPELEQHTIIEGFRLAANEYILATFHRPENVDAGPVLETVLTQLAALPLPVVLPLHPRTAERVTAFGLDHLLQRLYVTEPLGYRNFLALASQAAVLVSDSGGIQEEASVLKRPVVVVRHSTERPEINGTFGVLVPPGEKIVQVVERWLADIAGLHRRLTELPSPYGDGLAAERIVEAIALSQAQVGHPSPHLTSLASR